MRKVIATLVVVVLAVVSAAIAVVKRAPTPTPTAVIGEKPNKSKGGQVVSLLPKDLTKDQSKLLNVAYVAAKADGHTNPELVQAVLLQETHAGGMKSYRVANPGGDAYFGPMQLKLGAAKDVLAQWPGLYDKYSFHTKSDDEIKAFLILNEKFNIEVGSKYLMLLKKRYGFSGRELLNAYNRGPGGVKAVDDDYHYALGAEKKLAAYKRR